MGTNNVLTRLPVLRLLFPLAVGILLFKVTQSILLPILLMIISVIGLMSMVLLKKSPSLSLKLRSYHILPLLLFMVAVGWFAAYIASPPELDVKMLNGKKVMARVEAVEFHEKSMEMQVKLLNLDKADEQLELKNARILLSTKGCDYEMEAGDMILFTLDLSPVRNLGNPDEMDYASFLYNRGVRYRQHTKVESVIKVGESPTLMTHAACLRQNLEHKVLNSSLSPETQSLLIAVMLGNDDFISPETREQFSVVGVAHVLALSGLHVAIITLLIWFFLFPLDYIHAKKLRLILTLLILIGYSMLTGMSPSVIRSTVMIAFVFMSRLFYRKSTPLNSLAAAALVILVFSPGSLYSVGFQLSFITVAALILFYQTFEIKYPENKVLKYLYSILLTSVVAMLSSIILTAYYFNTVSLMTVVANFIILPIFPVFMIVGAVILLLMLIGGSLTILNEILEFVTNIINSSVNWLSSWSFGHSTVYVTWVAVVVYYAILVLVVMWIYKHNIRWLLVAGVVFVLGLTHSLIVDATVPGCGMVVFNSYNSTPVLYYNHGNALLWVPDVENDYDIEAFKRQHKAFLAHYRIDSVSLVKNSAEILTDGGVIKHPYARLNDKSIVSVGKGRWKNYLPGDKSEMVFDVLLVTKQYHSTIARARELYNFKLVVLSGDIYEDDVHALERECRELNVPFYSIKLDGAYMISQ